MKKRFFSFHIFFNSKESYSKGFSINEDRAVKIENTPSLLLEDEVVNIALEEGVIEPDEFKQITDVEEIDEDIYNSMVGE